MTPSQPLLFALNASADFGQKVSTHLGIPLSPHEEREFEDGEHKARPLIRVRGADVFVIQSLHGGTDQSVNDKLCRLLFFLGALRDASAERVTAVVPYLCYARKDQKTKSRDPVTTRYVAALFEAMGTERVVTMDVHNLAAYQNAFRCHTDHLEAKKLFVDHFKSIVGDCQTVVVSPDVGGIKRAEAFREALSSALGRTVSSAFMDKQRSEGVVRGERVVGQVEGRVSILIDDLISTGTTLLRAAKACREQGAIQVFAAATHGLFIGHADRMVADTALDGVVVTNTVPQDRLDDRLVQTRLTRLNAADLFADAIQRIHDGGSVVELLDS